MKFLKLELKYMLKKKINIVLIVLVVVMGFLTSYFFLRGIMADKILNNGEVEIIKGREAIDTKAQYDQVFEGEVTIEKLQKAREVYISNYDLVKEKTIHTRELFEVAPLLNVMQGLRFPIKENMTIIPWIDRNPPVEYADQYYFLRECMIQKYVEEISDKKISKKIYDMEEKIKKPFVYYKNYNNWGDSIEWLTMLIVLIMGMVIIISSTAFSETIGNGTKEIISITVEGERKFPLTRSLSLFIINTLLYIIPICIYLISIYTSLGGKGLQTSIQVDTPFSPANYTLGTAILLEVVGGYIGIIGFGFLSLLISSASKHSSTAITISIGIYVFYEAIKIFVRPKSKIVNLLIALFPAGVSQVFYEIFSYRFINIAGFVVWIPYFMILAGIVQIALYWYVSIKIYRL